MKKKINLHKLIFYLFFLFYFADGLAQDYHETTVAMEHLEEVLVVAENTNSNSFAYDIYGSLYYSNDVYIPWEPSIADGQYLSNNYSNYENINEDNYTFYMNDSGTNIIAIPAISNSTTVSDNSLSDVLTHDGLRFRYAFREPVNSVMTITSAPIVINTMSINELQISLDLYNQTLPTPMQHLNMVTFQDAWHTPNSTYTDLFQNWVSLMMYDYISNYDDYNEIYVDNHYSSYTNTSSYPTSVYWRDSDGDGFGDPNKPANLREPILGFVSNGSDCDDTDALNKTTDCEEDPCDEIKKLNNDATFKNVVTQLNKNLKLHNETGFEARRSNGKHDNPVDPIGHNSVGIHFADDDVYGFTHVHQDDFMLFGYPEKPIPIFSSPDVEIFLQLVLHAYDTNKPLSEVYAGVMSSTLGHLQLRFTGNPRDIISLNDRPEVLGEKGKVLYREAMDDAESYEAGLLDFIKNDLKLNGIELYKLNDDGISNQIVIDPNTKEIKEIPCN